MKSNKQLVLINNKLDNMMQRALTLTDGNKIHHRQALNIYEDILIIIDFLFELDLITRNDFMELYKDATMNQILITEQLMDSGTKVGENKTDG